MWVRRLALLNVSVNVMIVVTGGAVRLTGSGLGCPSWPNCSEESFHATSEMGVHGAIEWGNRLFGVVVGLVAVATFLAAWRRRPRRTSLMWLSALVAAGVPAQAIIGMFTVSSGLNPWVVSLHFLASVAVLAAAFACWTRSGEPDGPAQPRVPAQVRLLGWAVLAACLAAIALGVLVTGSGPHAGDPDAPRFGFDPELVTQLHTDAVFLLVGMSVAMVFTLWAVGAPQAALHAAIVLLAVEVAQGTIGFVQYFTGLPELLVGAHMLGACLLWLAALHVTFTLRTRLPAAVPTPPRPREDADASAPDVADEREVDAIRA